MSSRGEGLEVLSIASGPIEVQLLPAVGARLHRLRAFGHDLLRTPADPATHLRDPFRWGAYVMSPWCNRIAVTPTELGGRVVRPAANFDDGTAIHGQVYASLWQVDTDGTLWARAGGDGWPWRYEATFRVRIDGATLVLEQTLTNLADGAMPAGLGLHPWFVRPLELSVAADRVLPSNTDPAATFEPVTGNLDLRAMGPMADGVDAAWLVEREPAAELRWPRLDIRATMRITSEAGAIVVVVASPAELDAVAVEPQSHAPFGLGRLMHGEAHGLRLLAPGATLSLRTALDFATASA
jgi:aldose 1-epimerase